VEQNDKEPVSRAVHCGDDRRYRECRYSVLKTSLRDTANHQHRYSRGVCHCLFHRFQEIVSKKRQDEHPVGRIHPMSPNRTSKVYEKILVDLA
jgi:hypothetical protein